MPHKDGLWVCFAWEVAIHVPAHKKSQLFVVLRIILYQVPNLTNQSLHILLRIAIHKQVVLRTITLEVCIRSEFLLSKVPTHRPNLIIVACTLPFLGCISWEHYLPPSNYTFDSIHGNEIMPVICAPFIGVHHTILKHLFHFTIRFYIKLKQQFEPLFH
jgi:hypothetical protein